MNDNTNVNTEQQPTTPTPEDSGGQGSERTFTQEEVNRIVSERLAREREKAAQQPTPEALRERDLKARESRLDCREYLSAQGYPAELLDILDTSDTDKFKASADRLRALFGAQTTGGKNMPQIVFPSSSSDKIDPLARAFKSPGI